MGYPDKLLDHDEKVVVHLHPHWTTLIPATLFFVVLCALMGAGLAYNPADGTAGTIWTWVVLLLGLGLIVYLSAIPWLNWRMTHYVFTSHRVLIRKGILNITGRDIALQKINDVGFSKTLWDRLLRNGTLTIESAGEQGQSVLRDIPNTERNQQQLNRLIEADADRRQREAWGHLPNAPQYGDPRNPTQGYRPPPTQPC